MVYANIQGYAKFKAKFHNVSIRAWEDPVKKWYDFPYLATDDAIDTMLDQWLAEWCFTTDLAVGGSKSAMQKKKEAKLKMTQLTEKRKKEAADKAQADRNVV